MKPKIGIFGLSGCWGEQIVILNCEDELLAMAGEVDIVDFLGGSSVNDQQTDLTIAFVEGSVGSAREEQALARIRDRATLLVACGSCACFGGVAAMEGLRPRAELAGEVYGPLGARYDLSPHRPLSDLVKVDVSIPGCPIEKDEFLRAVAALLNGDLPTSASTPVCSECKMLEQECLLVSKHLACAGPVTSAGCHARCPGLNVACIGCRGPADEANFASLRHILEDAGFAEADVRKKLLTFATPIISRRGAES